MRGGNSRELNLWCPTLVLSSQTCFLLLLSGNYGYDRSCLFQAKMIINIRNELPSSCLGSLHQNGLCPEWSNARNGIYMTKSRTSFNKQLLDYWVFIKGMHHWRGSLCLSSSNGHHEQGNFIRIEFEKKNKHTCLALMSRFILV